MNQSLFASMMNNTSKGAINPDAMIDIELIDPYPFNEVLYPQQQDQHLFESLVDDIRESGLKQTIELRDMGNGRYQSIGGNRRCAAIRKLVSEENRQDLRYVKAKVSVYSDLESKQACIASNNYREKSQYSKLQEIKVLQELIQESKASGQGIKGSTRSLIAQAMKLSETQVNTYQTILNKGDEVLLAEIKSGDLSLEAAKQKVMNKDPEEVIFKTLNKLKSTTKTLSKNLESFDESSFGDLFIKIADIQQIVDQIHERVDSTLKRNDEGVGL